MSENLPVDIETEIMKRLHVKPLLQFRTVSKAWKSIIDSSEFINIYQGQVHNLLLTYTDDGNKFQYQKHVSIVDNDTTFAQQKHFPFVPDPVRMFRCFKIIGCSNGLLCLSGYYYMSYEDNDEMVVIWNISIRKAVVVRIPSVAYEYRNVIGFGVCRENNEPKIVKIKVINSRLKSVEGMSCIPWEVEVFSLTTGAWRSVDNNFARKSIELCRYCRSQVTIDDTLYWLATEKVVVIGSEDRSYNMIVSFDLTREEFKEVKLPDNLAQQPTYANLYISKSKLRKSLAVIEREDGVAGNRSFNVWMMEDGISESFTKLYTICVPDARICRVLEFRKNGEPILDVSESLDSDETSLVGYDPVTKRIKNIIEKDETEKDVYMSSYMETLHLHDQPDFVIYCKGKRFGLNKMWTCGRRI